MSVVFVTGAGTDIGKTYVTAMRVRQAIAAGRPVLALKPVASGVPAMDDDAFALTDTGQLLAAQGLDLTSANIERCSPWRFTKPLSPDMAAAAEGRALEVEAVLTWLRRRIADAPAGAAVFVEGVGGVMSPMTSDALNLDMMKALACPTLVVVGSYLGAINHALTALETLKAHGIDVAEVVLNESPDSSVDFKATLETLRRFTPTSKIALVRRGAPLIDHKPPN